MKTFKKNNCAPNKTRKRNNTCFTNKNLEMIKDYYNKDPNNINKINETDSIKIWKKLKKNIKDCNNEMCWIKQIPDISIQKKLKQQFAPIRPKKWLKNKNEWLSNYDIEKVLTQYSKIYPNFTFIGPTPIDFDKAMYGGCVWDELCKFNLDEYIKTGKNKIGIIFNLDKHDESGSHWVSLIVDIKNKYIMFFDSNGITCPPEICKLMDRIIEQAKSIKDPINLKKIQNDFQHQYSNTECGMYSLYFIITHVTETINNLKVPYKKIINHFQKKRIPDDYVFQLRDKYFN